MSEEITIAATGDSFITRRLAENDEDSKVIIDVMKQAEVRFTNLEVTTHDFEGYPSAVSGGAWAVAHPSVLEDLKKYGFNLLAWATNHALDFSFGGLEATEKYLNDHGFVHAGAGSNLAEASQPRYLETSSGRVAIISATSTFHESWRAGEQRPDMLGRPGVNPLRYNVEYHVTEDQMDLLKRIAEKTSINAVNNLHAKLGIRTNSDENLFFFGVYNFKIGDQEQQVTTPNKKDMNRILNSISEAKRQADIVLVSIHSHEMSGDNLEEPPQFLQEFARNCIDGGADSIIGHGPHLLRGIEVYRNRPIFYSLGNFIFQNDTMTKQPTEFYDKFSLDHSSSVADLYDARTSKDTKGFVIDDKIWSSIIPIWKMREGEMIELELYPIELGVEKPRSRRGWPKLSKRQDILEHLRKLSLPYGTEIQVKDGKWSVLL
ncbi:CapA family protein [Shouchella shacheensis]|uniref:CapA family protein n=1 Tax=Shouchella shacheensis TaxID=1649580 RepID=UPI0007400634|nr:CapA family protein [Shouchella shacheensis]